jgi:predicted HTH domain antitoxin
MGVKKISFEFPNDILLAIDETEKELKQRVKIALAVQLYKLQKLTLGKASQIAGLSRLEFENVLAENEISISNLTLEDVLNDSKKLN